MRAKLPKAVYQQLQKDFGETLATQLQARYNDTQLALDVHEKDYIKYENEQKQAFEDRSTYPTSFAPKEYLGDLSPEDQQRVTDLPLYEPYDSATNGVEFIAAMHQYAHAHVIYSDDKGATLFVRVEQLSPGYTAWAKKQAEKNAATSPQSFIQLLADWFSDPFDWEEKEEEIIEKNEINPADPHSAAKRAYAIENKSYTSQLSEKIIQLTKEQEKQSAQRKIESKKHTDQVRQDFYNAIINNNANYITTYISQATLKDLNDSLQLNMPFPEGSDTTFLDHALALYKTTTLDSEERANVDRMVSSLKKYGVARSTIRDLVYKVTNDPHDAQSIDFLTNPQKLTELLSNYIEIRDINLPMKDRHDTVLTYAILTYLKAINHTPPRINQANLYQKLIENLQAVDAHYISEKTKKSIDSSLKKDPKNQFLNQLSRNTTVVPAPPLILTDPAVSEQLDTVAPILLLGQPLFRHADSSSDPDNDSAIEEHPDDNDDSHDRHNSSNV